MTLISGKNKIFPIIVLLLAVTLNSFSAVKKALSEVMTISAQQADPKESKRTDAATPQNTEEQESDDKTEEADDPFMVEYFGTVLINHQVNHIYAFQIALYHEHHRVIFSPPPEA